MANFKKRTLPFGDLPDSEPSLAPKAARLSSLNSKLVTFEVQRSITRQFVLTEFRKERGVFKTDELDNHDTLAAIHLDLTTMHSKPLEAATGLSSVTYPMQQVPDVLKVLLMFLNTCMRKYKVLPPCVARCVKMLEGRVTLVIHAQHFDEVSDHLYFLYELLCEAFAGRSDVDLEMSGPNIKDLETFGLDIEEFARGDEMSEHVDSTVRDFLFEDHETAARNAWYRQDSLEGGQQWGVGANTDSPQAEIPAAREPRFGLVIVE